MVKKRNVLTFILAPLLIGTVACSPDSNAGAPTPSASVTTSAPVPGSPSLTSTPAPTYTAPDCGEMQDNSATTSGQTFQESDVVYYLFGCDEGERLLVRIKDGSGQVAHIPLQSEFHWAQISFASGKPVETTIYTKNQDVVPIQTTYLGNKFDLHVQDLVRLVGPTTNIKDLEAQACADYKIMGIVKDCSEMTEDYSRYFLLGDKAGWVNEYPS